MSILESAGCCPVSVLAKIALGEKFKVYLQKADKHKKVNPSITDRKDAAKELLKYISPQLSATRLDAGPTEGEGSFTISWGNASEKKD